MGKGEKRGQEREEEEEGGERFRAGAKEESEGGCEKVGGRRQREG